MIAKIQKIFTGFSFGKKQNRSKQSDKKKSRKWYFCSRYNCSDSCPGHFDPDNEPICQRKDGWYRKG